MTARGSLSPAPRMFQDGRFGGAAVVRSAASEPKVT